MTNNKKLQLFLGITAMLAATNDVNFSSKRGREDEQFNLDKRLKKINKQKGIKDFTIDGITVPARNYENALRKVNNIKKKQLIKR